MSAVTGIPSISKDDYRAVRVHPARLFHMKDAMRHKDIG